MQWQMPVECPVKVKMRNIAAEHNRSALTLIAEVQTGMDFRRYGQEETFDLVLFISEFHGNADRPINARDGMAPWIRGEQAIGVRPLSGTCTTSFARGTLSPPVPGPNSPLKAGELLRRQ